MWFGRWRRKSCRAQMTGSHPRRMRNPRCSPRSTGSTESPAMPNRLEVTRATSASSSTETADEDRTMANRTSVDRKRPLCLLGVLIGLSVTLGACTEGSEEIVTARIPEDYRLRHPIAIQEAD